MTAVSRLGLGGYGVRRAGSFAGKVPLLTVVDASSAPTGDVATLSLPATGPKTRLGPAGYGTRRTTSFAGKPYAPYLTVVSASSQPTSDVAALTTHVSATVSDASSQPATDIVALTPHGPPAATVSDASSQPATDVASLVASTPLVVHDTESDAVTDVATLTPHAPGALVLGINNASSQPTGDVASLTYNIPPSLSVTGVSSATAADAAGLTYHPRLSLPIGDAASSTTGGLSILTAYDPSGSRVVPNDAASDTTGDFALLTFNVASDSADLFDAASDTHGDVVALSTIPPLSANPARTVTLERPRRFDAQWDDIEPEEDDTFTLELTVDVPEGVTVLSVTWACTVSKIRGGATLDTNPSARIIGLPNVTTGFNPVTGKPTTFTNQRIGNNPVVGNKYLLEATYHTSDGRTISGYGHVWCSQPE